MQEYSSVVDASAECKRCAISTKCSADNTYLLEASAKNSQEIAIASASESESISKESELWATEKSKYHRDRILEYIESVSGISDISRSYAVGDTGIRENEGTDNAKYYYEMSNRYVNNFQAATLDEVIEFVRMAGEINGS